MALWWLSYRLNDRPFGAAIVSASTSDHARMIAVIDAGFSFAEGYMLDEAQSRAIMPGEIGRFLFLPQAEEIEMQFKA